VVRVAEKRSTPVNIKREFGKTQEDKKCETARIELTSLNQGNDTGGGLRNKALRQKTR